MIIHHRKYMNGRLFIGMHFADGFYDFLQLIFRYDHFDSLFRNFFDCSLFSNRWIGSFERAESSCSFHRE